MKNKEKFAKEIVELAIEDDSLAVDIKNKKVVPCTEIRCTECAFDKTKTGNCYIARREWAESEYVEPKEFTEEEKAILIALPKVNWVARDENETIYFFAEKPVKKTYVWDTVGDSICLVNWSDAKFSAIKWDDAEPTSREEILR